MDTRSYRDDHEITFGNTRDPESRHEGNPGSADTPQRAPKLLRPDGQPFQPDPPFGFTKG